MHAPRRTFTALALVALIARVASAQSIPDAADVTDASAESAPARTFGGVDEAQILHAIRTAHVGGSRRFGNTSVSFRLDLAGEINASFVPRGDGQWEAWRAEIAAFRLNRLLGLSRVPPAAARAVSRATLGVGDDSRVAGDPVRGAVVYWVPVIHDSRLESQPERARWEPWLQQSGAVPADQAERAEEISTMIVFDALIANWDRWSGSNISLDGSGHVIYRDNDGAFIEPLGRRLHAQVMAPLAHVERFSRGVIDRARALTADSIREEMSRDSESGRSVLGEAQIRGLLARRDEIVAHVDALVARYGDAAVFPWP